MSNSTTYLYRCTEQQLEEHLTRIVENGDTVEHVIFKGGRDYVLVCRPEVITSVTVTPSPEWAQTITDAVTAALDARSRGAIGAEVRTLGGAVL